MLRKFIESEDPKDKERLQDVMGRWRRDAEFEAVGDLEPIEQPLPLTYYYSTYLRIGQELPKDAEDTLIFYMVTLISNQTPRCFGLNSCKMTFYFGKFCEAKEFAREVEAHKILDAVKCPHIIKLQQSVQANEQGEGIIITYRYTPYSINILKPYTKEVMRQLLTAISCCHANGIIHRDIKPANIVFEWTKKQEHPHVYLVDFNVACKIEYHFSRTYDQSSCTECYQAPERLIWKTAKEPTKFDMWSAGVTFAEMLLGYDSWDQTLFEWGDKEELTEFQTKRHELFKDIDPVARDLLDKLLAVDVTQRLSSDEALMHPYFTHTDEQTSDDETNHEQSANDTDVTSDGESSCQSEEDSSSSETNNNNEEEANAVAMQEETSEPSMTVQKTNHSLLKSRFQQCFFTESEAVGDLKPLEKTLTLAEYVRVLRPYQPNLLEESSATRLYTVSLVSEKNEYHIGLNRAKLVYLFGKFCESNEFKQEVEAYKILDAAPQRSPHIIKLFQDITVNTSEEGFIITPRYKPYSNEILRPHTKEVIRQLLQAISCCHANGIIHGDIKPSNIVWEWNEEQQKPHIYLTDFGVSETLEHLKKCFMDTANCTRIYRAPERMYLKLSEEPTKMDLWSAGVTFAEMLLGYDSGDKTLFKWGDIKELEVFETKRNKLFKDIDPVARDLLDKLLIEDVKQRLSADEALMHPYFTQIDQEQPVLTNEAFTQTDDEHTSANETNDELQPSDADVTDDGEFNAVTAKETSADETNHEKPLGETNNEELLNTKYNVTNQKRKRDTSESTKSRKKQR